MKYLYQAIDGKIFEEEENCALYEQGLKKKEIENDVIGLDSNLNLINLSDYDITHFIDEIAYLIIKTDEAANIFYYLANEEDYCAPKEKGVFKWNDDSAHFDDLTIILKDLEVLKNKYLKNN